MGRSDDLPLHEFSSDKVLSGYLPHYDREFSALATSRLSVLEIGVLEGSSLELWSAYFPQAQIVGIDLNPVRIDASSFPRVQFAQGHQADTSFLDRVAAEFAPNGFDIIIDDASHFGWETRVAFEHLFENHLAPGGTYVIEDWQTGYWPEWSDGRRTAMRRVRTIETLRTRLRAVRGGGRLSRLLPHISHQQGMVGVLKQIVDTLGDPAHTSFLFPSARIERVVLTAGLAFITKTPVEAPPSGGD